MEGDRKPSRGRPKGRARSVTSIEPPEGVSASEAGDAPYPAEEGVEVSKDVSKGVEELRVAPSSVAERGLRGRRLPRHHLKTRPENISTKVGTSGAPIDLVANYFYMQKKQSFKLLQYHVDFEPAINEPRIYKKYLAQHKETLPIYIFDGTILFTLTCLEDPTVLQSTDKNTGEPVAITIKFTKELVAEDPGSIQFHNIILRSVMTSLQLDLLGRHYYDSTMKIDKPGWKLELWPGFMTSLRTCEDDKALMNVEVTHKVIRTETVLAMLSSIRHGLSNAPDDVKNQAMSEAVVGKIVMTKYNRKTYKINCIDWQSTPKGTFNTKKGDVTYLQYYKERYNLEINSPGQPLLVAEMRKEEVHRGEQRPVLLVPELCFLTGLDETQRANFQLTRDLSEHLHMVPGRRVDTITNFMKRVMGTPAIRDNLLTWNVRLIPEPVNIKGRVLPTEKIGFIRNGNLEQVPANAEWSKCFRDYQMVSTIALKSWVMIIPQRSAEGIDNLIRTMQKVGNPLNFRMGQPELVRIAQTHGHGYGDAVDKAMANFSGNVQLFFIVLPNNRADVYSAVKQKCSIEYGIPSQCFLAKNVGNKGLMSICTKVVIQMNAKLGGEPWIVGNPLNNLMVIGYDVYHAGLGGGNSFGCMTATVSKSLARYYSTISKMDGKREISEAIGNDILKCIEAYKQANGGVIPERIMFYRDGVGEGQLEDVYETELNHINKVLRQYYTHLQKDPPRFTFIIVTKRINTRLFSRQGPQFNNPPPGTVADTVITLPERYDFFLVSQSARQGTVSPCSFNVLYDSSGLTADRIQLFTFKLCHMYFNWSGTVAVPAPCQYAHKLAYLTGLSLKRSVHTSLHYLLHFL